MKPHEGWMKEMKLSAKCSTSHTKKNIVCHRPRGEVYVLVWYVLLCYTGYYASTNSMVSYVPHMWPRGRKAKKREVRKKKAHSRLKYSTL